MKYKVHLFTPRGDLRTIKCESYKTEIYTQGILMFDGDMGLIARWAGCYLAEKDDEE